MAIKRNPNTGNLLRTSNNKLATTCQADLECTDVCTDSDDMCFSMIVDGVTNDHCEKCSQVNGHQAILSGIFVGSEPEEGCDPNPQIGPFCSWSRTKGGFTTPFNDICDNLTNPGGATPPSAARSSVHWNVLAQLTGGLWNIYATFEIAWAALNFAGNSIEDKITVHWLRKGLEFSTCKGINVSFGVDDICLITRVGQDPYPDDDPCDLSNASAAVSGITCPASAMAVTNTLSAPVEYRRGKPVVSKGCKGCHQK